MNLSKKNKIALFIGLILLIAGYLTFSHLYQPHKSINERSVKFEGTAIDFTEMVIKDVTPWQDVVVKLNGKVTSINIDGFTLNANTFCQLQDSMDVSKVIVGQDIKIKARMIGYDELLEELKLDQTLILD